MPRYAQDKRPFSARGAAMKVWTCRDEEILIVGPAGTGKSRVLLEKMHYCAMKYPNFRGLLVRKTRESMTESVLVTFEKHVVSPRDPILRGPQRNLRQHYLYPNGSEIIVGGLDKSSKVMSTEYDMICVFESTELAEGEFEELTSRLRNHKMPYQQIIADCNPNHPRHWLKARSDRRQITTFKSVHQDNPLYYNEKFRSWTPDGLKYISKLSRLSGVRRLRLFKGIWAAAEGLVYEEFNDAIHLIPRFKIPEAWPKLRSIDFGYSNPFVCQWWAIDPDGAMYLYREIYHTHRIVSQHAMQIKMLSASESYLVTVADHDAEDRATLNNEGIQTLPAHKAIRPGLDAVEDRLRIMGNKKARIYLMRDALVERDEELAAAGKPVCTADEFPTYAYKKGQEGKPLKEEPHDLDNHGMDAMRYGVAYVDNVAGMLLKVETAQAVVVYRKAS